MSPRGAGVTGVAHGRDREQLPGSVEVALSLSQHGAWAQALASGCFLQEKPKRGDFFSCLASLEVGKCCSLKEQGGMRRRKRLAATPLLRGQRWSQHMSGEQGLHVPALTLLFIASFL